MEEKHYVYCLCQYNDELDSMYIAELYVPKKFRRKGYGRAAIDEAIGFIRDNNVKYARLSVRRFSWKTKWYKRLGFKVYKRKGLYNWMVKEL